MLEPESFYHGGREHKFNCPALKRHCSNGRGWSTDRSSSGARYVLLSKSNEKLEL